MRRLLQGGETAGMKPSEVLSHMKRLAPGKGNEVIIRTLFLGQMPDSIRPLLTVWEEEDLDKLAKMADKMLDANHNNTVIAVSTPTLHSNTNVAVDAVTPAMTFADICQAMKNLSDKIDQIQLQCNDKRNFNQQQRSRSRSRPRASQNTTSTTGTQLCW